VWQLEPERQARWHCLFGGPKPTEPFIGLQSEYIGVPYANTGLMKLPEEFTDDQAIMISDLVPTG
jgi:threonine dehydrogenase-like Zn-dependent dehydrogenase